MEKGQLRSHLRRLRAEIPPRERAVAADRLRSRAIRHGLLTRPFRVGFYIPFGAEMDPLPLLNHALWLGKACYLPVVPRGTERQMHFARLTRHGRWYRNRFGIHEHWSPRQIRARQLDLLFVPLVGFDESGYRLGMGGGFYDASLGYLRRRKVWRKPFLIGVAYERQKVHKVPHDPWDMPLDAVLTEERLYRFSRPSGSGE